MSDRTVVVRRRWRALLGATLFLALPGVAQAATVTSTADSGAGSLRDAIAASAAGDTIDFAPTLNGQTITLTSGALPISHSLTISGPGAGNLTINGDHNGSVFNIAPSAVNQDVTINGLTITGGATTTTDGGGIFANSFVRTLFLNGDTITGNQVTLSATTAAGGGGVYVNGGTLVVSGSTIVNNVVSFTGAASHTGGGGGLYDNGGDIEVSDSDVSNNGVTVSSSSGTSGGGAIYSNGGPVVLTGSTLRANAATINSSSGFDGGGAIYSNGGGVELSATRISGGALTLGGGTTGDSGGGAIYENGGPVTIVGSSIDANASAITGSTGGFDGGGGLFSDGGQIAVLDSSIANNTTQVNTGGDSNGGGAVFDDDGEDAFYLTSTLSGNTITFGSAAADNGGGAIRSSDGVKVSNVTIAGNRINAAGGAVFNEGSVDLKDTIIAGNGTANCAGTGTFTSAGFNLESTNTCGLNATGDLVNTEPQLGPVQNNGGSTLTQALPAGSRAVDAGSCTDIVGGQLTVDQRGVTRPQPAGGKCDIGAYELAQAGSPPPPPPSSPPTTIPGTPAATGSTGAGFSGSVNPQGQATTVSFQYGIDSRYRPAGGTAVIYDQSTPPQTLPADSTVHPVSGSASGLVPNALYHVRLAATNATGTSFGPDQTFTTPPAPPPPPPVLGRSVNVDPAGGRVFVLVGTKLVPLTQERQLPSGSVVDTRAGSLQLTTAVARHKRQSGTFGGAIFRFTQAGSGLTNLSLAEGVFQGAPTYATCKAHRAGEASAAASKTLQLLHASAKGKFRTTGRYSAATVRGTNWSIADRCDGTLTRDISHSIVVNDFVRHKTIVLHAGQSYLAKARAHGK